MPEPVTRPGDIMLHHNKGVISDLIRFFDGSDYSHSSLVLNDDTIAEVNEHGIGANPLRPAIRAGKFTDLYRLKESALVMTPVTDRVRYYVDIGGRYAFEQLAFLAILCATRRIPLPGIVRRLLRKVLDAAASALNRLIAGRHELMICSEFVYRCFDEALPEETDAFSIVLAIYPNRLLLSRQIEVATLGTEMRGVEHGSLLEAVARRSKLFGVLDTFPVALPPLLETTAEGSEAAIEKDAQLYLAAVAQGPDEGWLTPDDLAQDPELIARLNRLVAMTVQPPGAELNLSLGTLGYAMFSRTVADFVTPKDLCTSPSVVKIGRIEGA